MIGDLWRLLSSSNVVRLAVEQVVECNDTVSILFHVWVFRDTRYVRLPVITSTLTGHTWKRGPCKAMYFEAASFEVHLFCRGCRFGSVASVRHMWHACTHIPSLQCKSNCAGGTNTTHLACLYLFFCSISTYAPDWRECHYWSLPRLDWGKYFNSMETALHAHV